MHFYFKQITMYLLSIVFLTGCTETTTGVWEKSTYTERINRFLITEDGNRFVFIGEKYHYIFDTNESLKNVLFWKDRGLLEAQLLDKSFAVDSANNISGSFRVVCRCADAALAQYDWLKEAGFTKLHQKAGDLYFLPVKLSGVRYLSNNVNFDRYAKLNQTYEFRIKEPYSKLGIATRIMLTPIAVAEDGVATLGLIPLLVIAIPFYTVSKNRE